MPSAETITELTFASYLRQLARLEQHNQAMAQTEREQRNAQDNAALNGKNVPINEVICTPI